MVAPYMETVQQVKDLIGATKVTNQSCVVAWLFWVRVVVFRG